MDLKIMNSLVLFVSLLTYFYLLNLLDSHSTFLVVSLSSFRSERNPIARFIFKKFGLVRGIIILKSIILIITPLMIWVYVTDSFKINLTLIIANILYSVVVFNNYRNFFIVKEIRWRKFEGI